MSYGSILVPVDELPEAESSLEAACRLAALFTAHLEGVAIVRPLPSAQRLRPRQSAMALMKKEWERDGVEARAAARRFRERAAKAGVKDAIATVVEGDRAAVLAARARTADLVVLPRPSPEDLGVLGGHQVESTLLGVGRPVLLVPAKPLPAGFPSKALVAWNGSRECARALTDALPLLQKAKSVAVLTCGPSGTAGHGADVVAHLARHGVGAEAIHAAVDDARVGDAIAARARKLGADLVVMGAYGRSRLAEVILGGATRAALSQAPGALLMAH